MERVGTPRISDQCLQRRDAATHYRKLPCHFDQEDRRTAFFALASIVGMLPGTVMYVYFGSLGDLLKKSDSASALQIVYKIVIGVVTIFITLWVSRLAKKVLNEKTDFDEQELLTNFSPP
jgi:hypothetical protein